MLYNVVLISTIHRHDSVIGIQMSPDLNLPPTFHFIPLLQAVTEQGVWAPCVIQQIPTGYLFCIWQYICFNGTLPICPTLSSPHPLHKSVLFVRLSDSLPLSHHWATWEAHGAVGEVLNELDLDSWLCPGSQPSTPKSLRLWGTEAAAQLMNPGVKETSWALGPRKKPRARPKGMSGPPCSVGARCCITVGAENPATLAAANSSAVRMKRRTMRSNPARGGLRCPAQGGSDSEPAGKCSV